jgi:hypothetical protein
MQMRYLLFDKHSHHVLVHSWWFLILKVHISSVGRVVALAAMVLKCQADDGERSEQNPKHEESEYTVAER